MSKKTIPHPRGKNLRLACTWKFWNTGLVTPAYSPLDLTGKTLELFEVSIGAMASGWSFPITLAAGGQYEIWRDWDATWPDGIGPLLQFRVRATDKSIASPALTIELI